MNWDDFADAGATAATSVEQLCPDGIHVAEIQSAREATKEWFKSERNPHGKCLTVRMKVRDGIKHVYHDIPADRRGMLEALCGAAGVALTRGEWDEKQLEGRIVTIETALRVSKRGNEYVAVTQCTPGPELAKPEARARPARTQTQKADQASSAHHDDIPF